MHCRHMPGRLPAICRLRPVREGRVVPGQLNDRKEEIERRFGGTLSWERLDSKRASRIKHVIQRGGYRSPVSDWPEIQSEMVDKMSKLESALSSALDALAI